MFWQREAPCREVREEKKIFVANPYSNKTVECFEKDVTKLTVKDVIDLRTGVVRLCRQQVNYFLIINNLPIVEEGCTANEVLSGMWVYEQAGRLLKHLGYKDL